MTRNAARFALAHEITRRTVQAGDSYAATFGAALRAVYAAEAAEEFSVIVLLDEAAWARPTVARPDAAPGWDAHCATWGDLDPEFVDCAVWAIADPVPVLSVGGVAYSLAA